MLDTRLITFLTLLEEKSYTKTANRLYITQPAVTHHIKSLEKDNNITLFRDNKTFELTKAGLVLKEYALIAKQQYLQFENTLSKQSNKIVSSMAITPMVSACIKSLNVHEMLYHSKVKLNIYEYSYTKIMESLMDGTLDFAMVDNSFDSSIFDSFTLTTANLVVVCRPDGQFGAKDRITREQFSAATLILGSEDSGLYRAASAAIQQKNIRLKNNVVLHSNSIEWMVNQILLYDGIGILYEDSIREYLRKGILKHVELLNFQASQNIYLLYHRTSFLDNETVSLIENLKKYQVEKHA